MKTFDDYLDYIYGRGSSGGDHSLDKIKALMEYFGNPQDKIKTIHIAGTNGKGSTAKMLLSILSKKYRCGIFTSPYMVKINEEISINGEDISDHDFKNLIDRLIPYIDKLDKRGLRLTYFETLTAMAYIYFYEKKVDLAIIEVGLGGSLDSTNIIKSPLISFITSISKDHTKVLGDSLTEIAENKAGIIKKDRPLAMYPQKEEVENVVKTRARRLDSKIYSFDFDEIDIVSSATTGSVFNFKSYHDMRIKLRGIHQVYNAALVLTGLEYIKNIFPINEDQIRQGLYEAYNPGRLELISDRPRILVDGSHNKESIDALLATLKSFDYNRLIVCFSILKDKDYSYIIKKISKLSDILIITYIDDNPRAMKTSAIRNLACKYIEDIREIQDPYEAFNFSKSLANKDDLILWCGSLYLVGKVLAFSKIDNKL